MARHGSEVSAAVALIDRSRRIPSDRRDSYCIQKVSPVSMRVGGARGGVSLLITLTVATTASGTRSWHRTPAALAPRHHRTSSAAVSAAASATATGTRTAGMATSRSSTLLLMRVTQTEAITWSALNSIIASSPKDKHGRPSTCVRRWFARTRSHGHTHTSLTRAHAHARTRARARALSLSLSLSLSLRALLQKRRHGTKSGRQQSIRRVSNKAQG